MLLVAKGVAIPFRLEGIQPEMSFAAQVVDGCYFNAGHPFCYVTSCTDGKHSVGSRHYCGAALDFRVRDITLADREKLVNLIRLGLSDEFDVVLEPDHIHVEFDPRK